MITGESSGKRGRESSNKKKKNLDRINNMEKNSSRKRRETEKSTEKNGNNMETWSKVIGRKERRQNSKEESHKKAGKIKEADKVKKRKPLRTSAVVITTGDNNTSYSEILAWARQSVKLNKEEMNTLSTKRSATGGILLEIRGNRNKEIAEKLAESLRIDLSKYRNVRIHKPRQMAESTLVGLDVSVTREEVRRAVAREGGCAPDDVTVGIIENSPRGTGYVWVKCPIETNILEDKKKIKIGWANVKVNMLLIRRMQCFRCLRTGHTKARCDSPTDRSGLCYNCGQGGHKAVACKDRLKCIFCEEAGKTSNHRIGGPRCSAPPSKGRVGAFRRSPSKSPEKINGERNVQMEHRRYEEEIVEAIPTEELNGVIMETEELEDSVESDLVEDYYGSKHTTDKPQSL